MAYLSIAPQNYLELRSTEALCENFYLLEPIYRLNFYNEVTIVDMSGLTLNPFRYGNPVPPDRFIGRRDAIRIVFSRIRNCESTAVVGEPHIGKSSALRYITHGRVQLEWLGEVASQCVFIEIDCHLLPESYQPADFWKYVLDYLESAFPDPTIQTQLEVVRRSDFGSFTLERLFKLLGLSELHAILIIDEFDALLHHPNFNTAEFFGALRSLSTRTEGLLLVTASRLSVAEMNRRSQEINPLGSPFFNTFTEVHLLPLRPEEVDLLLDQALASTDVALSQDDRMYIRRASGRHPYLVQMAAAALFEVVTQGRIGPADYEKAGTMLRGWAEAHFNDLWHCLDEKAQAAMVILALAEIRGRTGRQKPNISHLGTLEQHGLEVRWLADGGMIELADKRTPAATWRGDRWRISAESLARWIVDTRKWEQLASPVSAPPPDPAERAERVAALRQKINALHKRLEQRELQVAKLGIHADPAMINEIEDLKRMIAEDERQLRNL